MQGRDTEPDRRDTTRQPLAYPKNGLQGCTRLTPEKFHFAKVNYRRPTNTIPYGSDHVALWAASKGFEAARSKGGDAARPWEIFHWAGRDANAPASQRKPAKSSFVPSFAAMLQIYKNAAITHVSKESIDIRALEMEWYTRNYDTMAAQAAMFAGFAFEQITETIWREPIPAQTPFILEMAYISLTAIALGFNLCVCMTCTFCVIFGQRLALMGYNGARSVHVAVENLHKAQQFTFVQFLLGILGYLMSHIFGTWIYFEKEVAQLICVPLSVFFLAIIYYVVTIVDKLILPDDKAVFGRFFAWSRYEQLNDLDEEAFRHPHSQRVLRTAR
eukprot:s2296_g3.t1